MNHIKMELTIFFVDQESERRTVKFMIYLTYSSLVKIVTVSSCLGMSTYFYANFFLSIILTSIIYTRGWGTQCCI